MKLEKQTITTFFDGETRVCNQLGGSDCVMAPAGTNCRLCRIGNRGMQIANDFLGKTDLWKSGQSLGISGISSYNPNRHFTIVLNNGRITFGTYSEFE